MNGFLYIIQSQKNQRYYVGSTNDIERRLEEHNRGKMAYTRLTRPWKLVYLKGFETLVEARQAEHKLKKQKSRIILENLIRAY